MSKWQILTIFGRVLSQLSILIVIHIFIIAMRSIFAYKMTITQQTKIIIVVQFEGANWPFLGHFNIPRQMTSMSNFIVIDACHH